MTSTSIPQTMKAFVIQGKQNASVQEIPVPTINDNEVLVRTVAVAQNPTDWKSIKYFDRHGVISGCDYSGYVVQTGKNVTNLSVGDHVAGFVMGAQFQDRGAFAEYVKVAGDLAIKIPEGTLSHQEAATLGCALWTSIQALFHPTRLGLVEPPNKVGKDEWILIYGGSSSVGMYAIQLAHAAGYKIVTTASARNFELVKSLGANVAIDYNIPDAVAQVKEATGDSIHFAYDTISLPETQKFSVNALASGSGKVVTVLPVDEGAKKLRDDVVVDVTVVYTTHGIQFDFRGTLFPASAQDRTHTVEFLKKVPELLKSGQLKPNPVKVLPGGLDGIQDGLRYMEEGNVSGVKLVYNVSEPVL